MTLQPRLLILRACRSRRAGQSDAPSRRRADSLRVLITFRGPVDALLRATERRFRTIGQSFLCPGDPSSLSARWPKSTRLLIRSAGDARAGGSGGDGVCSWLSASWICRRMPNRATTARITNPRMRTASTLTQVLTARAMKPLRAGDSASKLRG